MQTKNDTSIPRLFIIISVVFGLLLAAFGIASGSNPLVQPDMATYKKQLQQNPVKAEQLADWMVEGKRDFRVAGFRSVEECKRQKQVTRKFKCYDNNINDRRWVRKTFKNINMPLVIYGGDTAEGLAAAAQLKHLGYDVQYLEEGFNGFSSQFLNKEMNGDETDAISRFFAGNDPLIKKKGQKWVVASADDMIEEEEEGVELGDEEEEEDEEEDEEEEEGC